MTFRRILWLFANILLVARFIEARTTGTIPSAGIHGGEIPRTSFTCRGRDTGYYADVEADCQAYHMCDEQGRQFSYLCPNATLFQQRMLICDHWYMVDCLSSEANYGFNRLIGQRDQHFVSDADAEKRTPRPDLLDRPYAADYKGESFRKAIGKSNFPALQNAIAGFTKNVDRKYEILETQASSNILPPQINTNNLDPTSIPASEEFPRVDKINERRNAFSAESEENFEKKMSPPPTGFEPPKLLPTYNSEFRRQEEARLKQLGLPIQAVTAQKSPQKTVSEFNSQPVASQFKPQTPTARPVTTSFQSTKKPADKTFDPDKNFKAFEHILQPGKKATHKDYDFSRYFSKKQSSDPTTAPAQRQDFGSFNKQVTASTTKRTFVQQTVSTTQRTFAPTTTRPQTTTRAAPVTTTTRKPVTTTTTTRKPVTTTTTQASRAQSLNQASAFNKIKQNNQFSRPSTTATKQNGVEAPARDLLPPLDVLRNYDDATTKGPAIYYEWKVPDRGLLPPKLDNDTEAQSKRSVTEVGNFDNSNDFLTSESRRTGNGNSKKIQYKDLQRMFAIPQFDFPIEVDGRIGYENSEAVNSFQVKIPYRGDKQEGRDRYYYLEHAACNPECHPYFFKPGRCEPCVKL